MNNVTSFKLCYSSLEKHTVLRTVARKLSIGGVLRLIPLIYNVLYFNLGELGPFLGG